MMESTAVVYNAGGGAGRKNLQFETLFDGQCKMFERTLNQQSDFQTQHLEQEKRQITVVDRPITIHINIAREDFPAVTARIKVVYDPAASQQAWALLIKDVCKALKIDFIYCIMDRYNKSPVHRILRLRDNGDYLARQRETSSILEVINTGTTPVEVSWDITMDINDVKQSLRLDEKNMPVIDKRVADLVAKPVTRETQRDIATLLLNAKSAKATVSIMEQFHKQYKGAQGVTEDETAADGENKEAEQAATNYGDTAKYGDAIDIVTLHRLCLEKLTRLAAKGMPKQIASSPCFEYICDVIDGLRQEVDVVAMGLKLLSDVMKYLVEERERVLHVVLNCVQAYAPPAQKHRPRFPKRLRPPEEQYEESKALLMGEAAGGAGGAGNALSGYGGSQKATGSGGGGGFASNARDAPPPTVNPSLARYGDFYGNSAFPQKDAALHLSESISLSKLYDHSHTDTHRRFDRTSLAAPHSAGTAGKSTDGHTSSRPSSAEVAAAANQPPAEVKALVRGRVRIDHQAASQALQSAFHTGPSAPHPASTAAPTAPAAPVSTPGPLGKSMAASTSSELVVETGKEKPLESGVAAAATPKRSGRYQFKFKPKGQADGGALSDGADTGDEKEKKAQWRGTAGVIGRKAPEKVKEVKIDFKKKIVYDPTKDPSEQESDSRPASAVVKEKTPEELEAAAAEAAENAVVAEAMQAVSASTMKRKKKRNKLTLVPLPLVPCVIFRGLSGKCKQNLAMMQSFATLFKMMSQNYGNREAAFRLGVAEEVSVIVTVCQGMPRVLDYYIWIIDALYRDGFGEINADELDIALEDYTMVLSASTDAKKPKKASADGDSTSMTGFQFETMSEMTVPTVDEDGLRSEATPVVSIGEIPPDEVDVTGKKARRATKVAPGAAAGAGADDGTHVGTDDAIDENEQVPSNQIKKAANQLLVNSLGLFEFEARYVKRPVDDIVIGVAMIAMHTELESREKMTALKWLDVWDDGSRDYKNLKKKGFDLSGL